MPTPDNIPSTPRSQELWQCVESPLVIFGGFSTTSSYYYKPLGVSASLFWTDQELPEDTAKKMDWAHRGGQYRLSRPEQKC